MKALTALVTEEDIFACHLKMTRHVHSLSDGQDVSFLRTFQVRSFVLVSVIIIFPERKTNHACIKRKDTKVVGVEV